MFPKSEKYQALIDSYNARDPHPEIGTILDRTKNAMVAVYDFDVDGGTVGVINLVDDKGDPAVLPPGAIVTNVVANTITDLTSGGLATISLGVIADADLAAADAFSNYVAGFKAGAPVGTAATWVGPVVAGLGSRIYAKVAVAALTAGKIYFNIEYVINKLT